MDYDPIAIHHEKSNLEENQSFGIGMFANMQECREYCLKRGIPFTEHSKKTWTTGALTILSERITADQILEQSHLNPRSELSLFQFLGTAINLREKDYVFAPYIYRSKGYWSDLSRYLELEKEPVIGILTSLRAELYYSIQSKKEFADLFWEKASEFIRAYEDKVRENDTPEQFQQLKNAFSSHDLRSFMTTAHNSTRSIRAWGLSELDLLYQNRVDNIGQLSEYHISLLTMKKMRNHTADDEKRFREKVGAETGLNFTHDRSTLYMSNLLIYNNPQRLETR